MSPFSRGDILTELTSSFDKEITYTPAHSGSTIRDGNFHNLAQNLRAQSVEIRPSAGVDFMLPLPSLRRVG